MSATAARAEAWIADVGATDRLVVAYRPNAPGPGLEVFASGVMSTPSSAAEPDCTVVFDGRLYNRAQFAARVPAPDDATDAAFLLAAFRALGEELFGELRGEYVLLIADRTGQALRAVRDTTGTYPLFWASDGEAILFSTSPQALISQPGVSGALNRPVLAEHLCYRYPRNQETYFEAVHRVPPGHVADFNRDGFRGVRRYWDPVPAGSTVEWAGDEELERFDELFEQAVARKLGPASRGGILLSGGLDSVSVATVMTDICQREGRKLPVALSLHFPNDLGQREAVIQRGVAEALGIEQVLMPLETAMDPRGLLLSALDISATWPAPLMAMFSSPYSSLLSEGKARGCEVALTGGGGDDWLSVAPHWAADLMAMGKFRDLFHMWNAYSRSYSPSRAKFAYRLLWTYGFRLLLAETEDRTLRRLAPSLLLAHRSRKSEGRIRDWIAPDPTLRTTMRERMNEVLWAKRPRHGNFYLEQGRIAMNHMLVSMELEEGFEKGERMRLPLRLPFWDPDLIDFLYRVPPWLLNRGGRSKALIRERLGRRYKAIELTKQKKFTGGNFWPMKLEEAAEAWKRYGGAQGLAELGIVDADSLDGVVQRKLTEGKPIYPYQIWWTLNVEAWVRSRI